jgi:hypothetical protein
MVFTKAHHQSLARAISHLQDLIPRTHFSIIFPSTSGFEVKPHRIKIVYVSLPPAIAGHSAHHNPGDVINLSIEAHI